MDTERLIEELAESAQPVRRLAPPERRLAQWLTLALPPVLLIAWAVGFRPDLALKAADPLFVVQVLAALSTAVAAGWAALSAVVPGESRWKLVVPVAPFTVWLSAIGQQCWSEWLLFGDIAMRLPAEDVCAPFVVMVGAVPAIAMVALIRRGAALQPRLTVFLGALAAGALGDFGLRLFHHTDAGLVVLVWHLGTVAALAALAGLYGRRIVRPGV